jgi:glycosyltransferase involved in cell wall biosynthesis
MSAAEVSVLVPAYNAERYLGEALDSVLSQTQPPLEVIVVDDGSSDGTSAVAERFGERVRYERRAHAGIGSTRNRCVELARGDYIAFVDADDRWEPDKLERQLSAAQAEPWADIVFGHVRQFVSPDVPAQNRARIVCPPEPQPGYVLGAMLATRAAFGRVGPFATNLHVGEFIDWMARARELGLRELMLPGTVLWRRLHDANQGVRHRDRMGDFAHVLKASLDRRRAGGAR